MAWRRRHAAAHTPAAGSSALSRDLTRLPAGTCLLVALGIAIGAQIVDVDERHRSALDREGLSVGTAVTLEAALPFGGPVVVRTGNARVALARDVAASVVVRPTAADPVASEDA